MKDLRDKINFSDFSYKHYIKHLIQPIENEKTYTILASATASGFLWLLREY